MFVGIYFGFDIFVVKDVVDMSEIFVVEFSYVIVVEVVWFF